MQSLVEYLGCGRYKERSSGFAAGDFLVTKINYINDKIIPFNFLISTLFKDQNLNIFHILRK